MPLDDTLTHHPKRVLIGADTFAPDVNGAARFTMEHAARLARRGHEVHVVAPATELRSSSGMEMFDGQPIVVHRLRSIKWPPHEWLRVAMPWEVRRYVRRIIAEVRPDVVHLQSFIDIGRGLAIEADRAGVPLVATNHVMPDNFVEFSGVPRVMHERLARFGWDLAHRVYSRADVVTSPTPIAANYLAAQARLPEVLPVSCGIDLSRFAPKSERPNRNRILFVGRLDPEKNLTTLLDAFALIPAGYNASLEIVGHGSERARLEAHAARLGVTDRVVFRGYVADEELVQILHTATVFVMPSTAELQSIATLEAMASGTPVVLADAMALPHLVATGHEGFLVPPTDAAAFAARITHILDLDAVAYEQMSRAAHTTARTHDCDAVTDRFEALYERSLVGAR